MSMSLEQVESARIGTVLHHTTMHLIGLESITSVETQMENPMLGVTQWLTRDGSFVTSGHAIGVTKIFLNLKTCQLFATHTAAVGETLLKRNFTNKQLYTCFFNYQVYSKSNRDCIKTSTEFV